MVTKIHVQVLSTFKLTAWACYMHDLLGFVMFFIVWGCHNLFTLWNIILYLFFPGGVCKLYMLAAFDIIHLLKTQHYLFQLLCSFLWNWKNAKVLSVLEWLFCRLHGILCWPLMCFIGMSLPTSLATCLSLKKMTWTDETNHTLTLETYFLNNKVNM
jgi:hypothetical protein